MTEVGLGAGLLVDGVFPTWIDEGRLVTVLVVFAGEAAAGAGGAVVTAGSEMGWFSLLCDGTAFFTGDFNPSSTGTSGAGAGNSDGPFRVVSLESSPFSTSGKPLLVGDADNGLFRLATSSELKLLTLGEAAGLSLRPLALRRPAAGDCTAPSTAMKLARTLDNGLPEPEFSESTGDRPREGGEVLLWLFSNRARRFLTPG